MTDESPKKPYGIVWYAAWIVLALVVYVASAGPMVYLSALSGQPTLLRIVGRVTEPAFDLFGSDSAVSRYQERWIHAAVNVINERAVREY